MKLDCYVNPQGTVIIERKYAESLAALNGAEIDPKKWRLTNSEKPERTLTLANDKRNYEIDPNNAYYKAIYEKSIERASHANA